MAAADADAAAIARTLLSARSLTLPCACRVSPQLTSSSQSMLLSKIQILRDNVEEKVDDVRESSATSVYDLKGAVEAQQKMLVVKLVEKLDGHKVSIAEDLGKLRAEVHDDLSATDEKTLKVRLACDEMMTMLQSDVERLSGDLKTEMVIQDGHCRDKMWNQMLEVKTAMTNEFRALEKDFGRRVEFIGGVVDKSESDMKTSMGELKATTKVSIDRGMQSITDTVNHELHTVVEGQGQKMTSLEDSLKLQMDIMNNRIKADMTPKLDECLAATSRVEGMQAGLNDRVKMTVQEINEQFEEVTTSLTDRIEKVCEAAELEAFLMHLAKEADITMGQVGVDDD